jgi:hypothetical protein
MAPNQTPREMPSQLRARRRFFRCCCEDGHTTIVETPEEEVESRATLARARCECGGTYFTAVELLD